MRSFSTQINGSVLKNMMLYASLLCPPDCASRVAAAWRAIQKLKRDESTAPSLLSAVGIINRAPAEFRSGFRSERDMDWELYHMR